MNELHKNIADGDCGAASAAVRPQLPPEFVELVELSSASIERGLGYFRNERFVIFGYCPGGGDVIWKDGHSSGFGGGWRIFLNEIAPLAMRYKVSVGDLNSAGTHVLVMDRLGGEVYAAPRRVAEEFLAGVYELPPPKRLCMCARLGCATCPVDTCPFARSADREDDAGEVSTGYFPRSGAAGQGQA